MSTANAVTSDPSIRPIDAAAPDTDIDTKDDSHVTSKELEAGAGVPPSHGEVKEAERMESAFIGLTRWQASKKFWRASLYCYVCAFCVMMDGFQSSLPGSILANEGFIKQFGTVLQADGSVALNAQYISTWSGVAYVGQVSGNLFGGAVSDRFGRLTVLYIMTCVFALAIIVEMVARNWKHWLVAKLLMGIAAGLVQSGILTYMSELAPSQIRGMLLSTYGWGYALGQLFVSIALQIVNVTEPQAWLKAIYAEWLPLGLWIIMLVFLPETPWYHVKKGQGEKAKRSLAKIYKNVEGYDVEKEYEAMVLEVEHERQIKEQDTTAWKDILKGTDLKRTFAAVFALACQNWAGSSVVFNYTTFFFQQAGLPNAFQSSVIVYAILIFSIMVSFYVVERVGRRPLVVGGGVIVTVLNVLIGALGCIKQTTPVQNAILAIICIWVFCYAIFFAGTGWIFCGEIATPRLRAKTAAFVAMSNAVAGAIYNTTGVKVPLMLSNDGAGARGWGLKTLFMFAILMGIGTIINFFMIPETKGRSYNELDEMYQARIPPRRMQQHRSKIEIAGLKRH